MKEGFTLIELIIVIAIIAILVGAGLASYGLFERNTELEISAQNIITILRLAQTKTISSEDASSYGVYFESDQYILFKGEMYESGSSTNKVYNLPNNLEIYDIQLSTTSDQISFSRLEGNAQTTGTIGLRRTSDYSQNITIVIQPSGHSEITSTPNSTSTTNRISDTRHTHFDLEWSIQGSNTLTLYFSDSPVHIENIDMSTYFTPGETEFDWSDTIDVNGQTQEFHIHTHSLDVMNTVLCVHRDLDHNSKPVSISIDDKNIVSYDSNGIITIGLYGGTHEIQ